MADGADKRIHCQTKGKINERQRLEDQRWLNNKTGNDMSSENATGYLPIGFSNRLKFNMCWINSLLHKRGRYYKDNRGKGKQRTQGFTSQSRLLPLIKHNLSITGSTLKGSNVTHNSLLHCSSSACVNKCVLNHAVLGSILSGTTYRADLCSSVFLNQSE